LGAGLSAPGTELADAMGWDVSAAEEAESEGAEQENNIIASAIAIKGW
jgi:hypothetical protein